MGKSAVLFSGGVDSVVLAHHVARTGDLSHLLLIDYGQVSAGRQANIGIKLAQTLGCSYERIYLPIAVALDAPPTLGQFNAGYKPAEVVTRDNLSEHDSLVDVEAWQFVEGRNLLFLTLASIFCANHKIDTLYFGLQLNSNERGLNSDPSGARRGQDNNGHYVKAFNDLAFQSFSFPFTVQTPFLMFTKAQVVSLGKSLGVDFNLTYSCEFGPSPCGRCSQCLEVKSLLEGDA